MNTTNQRGPQEDFVGSCTWGLGKAFLWPAVSHASTYETDNEGVFSGWTLIFFGSLAGSLLAENLLFPSPMFPGLMLGGRRQVVGCVDQGEMRKGLWKVAQHPFLFRIIFF